MVSVLRDNRPEEIGLRTTMTASSHHSNESLDDEARPSTGDPELDEDSEVKGTTFM